jgi:hypothetical protein
LIKSQLLYQLSYRGNQHCDVPRRIGTETFYFTVAKQQALLADLNLEPTPKAFGAALPIDDHVEVEVFDLVGFRIGGSCCKICNN